MKALVQLGSGSRTTRGAAFNTVKIDAAKTPIGDQLYNRAPPEIADNRMVANPL